MSIVRFNPPYEVTNLKNERMWDVTWSRQTFPTQDFDFYLLQKTESGYIVHARCTDAMESFDFRKQLVAEGVSKPFIRAKQRQAPQDRFSAYDDSDATLDFFRDKHNEGVGLEDIPRHLRAGYLAYQRGRRSAR